MTFHGLNMVKYISHMKTISSYCIYNVSLKGILRFIGFGQNHSVPELAQLGENGSCGIFATFRLF